MTISTSQPIAHLLHDYSALSHKQVWRTTGTTPHVQPLPSQRIKVRRMIPDALATTVEDFGDLVSAWAILSARRHLGVRDPASGRMHAMGAPARLTFLQCVERRTAREMLRAPFAGLRPHIVRRVEERGTRG